MGGGEGRGGRSIDGHLGKHPQRLYKYYFIVDPGRGSIDSQLGKDLQRLCKITSVLGRICEDFAGLPRVILEGSIDSYLGRICKDFARITSVLILGCQLMVTLGWICKDFARITSLLILGGG